MAENNSSDSFLLDVIDNYLVQKKDELELIGSILDCDVNDKAHLLGLSKILTYTNRIKLIKLCGFEPDLKWELLYRGSRDGFLAENFHFRCDGKNKTLTIIKTKEGFIFGGYTDGEWTCENKYISDKNAFIFSLLNAKKCPVVIKCSDEKYAIYGGSCYGPCFGYSCSLYVGNYSNVNAFSCSDLSYNYKLDEAIDGTEASTFLAGKEYFTIEDIEVFQKQPQN